MNDLNVLKKIKFSKLEENIINYLIDNNNQTELTYPELAKNLNCGRNTMSITIRKMISKGIISTKQKGHNNEYIIILNNNIIKNIKKYTKQDNLTILRFSDRDIDVINYFKSNNFINNKVIYYNTMEEVDNLLNLKYGESYFTINKLSKINFINWNRKDKKISLNNDVVKNIIDLFK